MSGTNPPGMPFRRRPKPLALHIGHDALVIQARYEAASILNDILIALWFIVGSIMSLSTAWATTGTWCFVLGSVELLIRPAIRMTRQIHLRRMPGDNDVVAESGSQDF